MPRKKKEEGGIGGNYSTPPETEVKLRNLQSQFLSDRNNKKIFDEYFLLMRTYTRSLTLKKIKNKGLFLPPERVDEICTDAVLSIFKQYETEGWSISKSWAGVINFKIIEAMYKRAEDEQALSLNTKFSKDDENSKEIMDLVGTESTIPWDSSRCSNDIYVNDPDKELMESINVSYKEVNDILDFSYENLPFPTFMRFLPWVVLQFRKPKTRNVQSAFDRLFLSNGEQNAFDILFLEIHNRISENIS